MRFKLESIDTSDGLRLVFRIPNEYHEYYADFKIPGRGSEEFMESLGMSAGMENEGFGYWRTESEYEIKIVRVDEIKEIKENIDLNLTEMV